MVETSLSPTPALPETRARARRDECEIVYLAAGHILQVLARASAGDMSSHLVEMFGASARRAGPHVWWIVGDGELSPAAIHDLRARLGREATLIDQSHGRVRIEVSGPSCRALLATGCAVNLAPSALPVGAGRECLFGHIGVHLTRTGEDQFELLVGRSFAQSLWEELTG